MSLASEADFLTLLDELFERPGEVHARAGLALGRDDDCVVLDGSTQSGPLVVSTDLFIEDEHFRLAYFTPQQAGAKALAVNLSDIAAMGARPHSFQLGLGVPRHTDAETLCGFLTGMAGMARTHGCLLSGGDVTRAPALTACITVTGVAVHPPLARATARPGNVIFLLGSCGLARLGLVLLESTLHGHRAVDDVRRMAPAAVAAHLTPVPRVNDGLALAASGVVTSLMDVSDGLAADLPRLLGHAHREAAAPLGADVAIANDAIHPEIREHCSREGLDPVAFALQGGEEYALLGTCLPDALPNLPDGALHLGFVTDSGTITVNGTPLTSGGYDHFSSN